MSAFVSFEQVNKTYDGEHLIVRDLNLAINRGEFLSLLGPSGSGKTTTLMMLAGFESPTSGDIRLEDQLINKIPPHKRNFGMVFQNYALFPHLSVAENIAYPLSVRKVGRSEREERVNRALDRVHMRALAHRYPAQLSGGQQQRIALARALVYEPRLVLMDEPLGALDKQLREHMQLELKSLHRQLGLTFVYVTHDQSEALTMSDRVAVFNEGCIQQIDPVETLYENPGNQFVASFVGDSCVFLGKVLRVEGAQAEVALADSAWTLWGRNINQGKIGEQAICHIRPERIRATPLSSASEDSIASNQMIAKIDDIIYHGDHLRLQCAYGKLSIFVKVPMMAGIHFQREQNVLLDLNPQSVRVFV